MTADSTAGTPDIDYDAWRAAIRRDVLSNYHYSMARAIAREGNRAVAIEQLRHAIAADSAMVPAYAELADLLHAEGRVAEAEAAERAAAAVSADWRAEALLRSGEELAAAGRSKEACDVFTAVASRFPDLRARADEAIAEIRFACVLRHRLDGDQDGAVSILRELTGYDGDNASLLSEVSLQLMADGDLDEAAARAMKAARLGPPNRRVEFVWQAMDLLVRQFRFQEATSFLEEQIAADPDLLMPSFMLGYARALQGGFAEAEHALRRALVLNPALPGGWLTLGYVRSASGLTTAVNEMLRRTLRCLPGHFVALAELAAVLSETGRHEEAIGQAEAARSRVPDASGIPLVAVPQAIVLVTAGRFEAAREMLRTAVIATEPKDRVVFWLRARLHPRHLKALTALFTEVGLALPASPTAARRV